MSNRFKRCVVIVNRASTHSVRGQRFVQELRQLFSDEQLEIVNSPKDRAKNIELIRRLSRKLDERSLLCIIGGDGTVSSIINILLTDPDVSDKGRRAVVLPLWGGNANDLAYMANGIARVSKLPRIIREGQVAPVHPLAVTTKHGHDILTRLAICYVSFGASAYASHLMNTPRHRNRRIYRLPGARPIFEGLNVMHALTKTKPFISEIDGKSKRLYDLILINGPRIAKINRTPIRITDERFYELRIYRKHPLVLGYIAKIAESLSSRRNTKTEQLLTAKEGTWAQLDGEVHYIPANTHITVRPHNLAFSILSLKLPR